MFLEPETPPVEPTPETVTTQAEFKPWAQKESPPKPNSWALAWLLMMVPVTLVYYLLYFHGSGGVLRSADGRIEMRLPRGWKQAAGPPGAGPIFATGSAGAEWLNVRSASKQDFPSLEAYDADSKREVLAWLSQPAATESEPIVVNGHRAVRSEIRGKMPDGTPVWFVVTAVETETRFSEVFVWASESQFSEDKSKLARLANGLRETGP